jgi:hypothetical protein
MHSASFPCSVDCVVELLPFEIKRSWWIFSCNWICQQFRQKSSNAVEIGILDRSCDRSGGQTAQVLAWPLQRIRRPLLIYPIWSLFLNHVPAPFAKSALMRLLSSISGPGAQAWNHAKYTSYLVGTYSNTLWNFTVNTLCVSPYKPSQVQYSLNTCHWQCERLNSIVASSS